MQKNNKRSLIQYLNLLNLHGHGRDIKSYLLKKKELEMVKEVISLVSATVPDALGNVIVLSAVGSATVKVVSFASPVAPSKVIRLPAFRKRPSFLILATISCEPPDTTANSIRPSSEPADAS